MGTGSEIDEQVGRLVVVISRAEAVIPTEPGNDAAAREGLALVKAYLRLTDPVYRTAAAVILDALARLDEAAQVRGRGVGPARSG